MKAKYIFVITFLIWCSSDLNSQNVDRFMKSMVASDTILHGNSFEYKIIIRNMSGEFTPPTIDNFNIVGGPNMSSKMLYNNGEMFKESSYSYLLEAKKVGEYYIGEVVLTIDGENLHIPPVPIQVIENPDQITLKYSLNEKAVTAMSFPIDADGSNLEKNTKKKVLKKI